MSCDAQTSHTKLIIFLHRPALEVLSLYPENLMTSTIVFPYNYRVTDFAGYPGAIVPLIRSRSLRGMGSQLNIMSLNCANSFSMITLQNSQIIDLVHCSLSLKPLKLYVTAKRLLVSLLPTIVSIFFPE